MSYTRIAKPPQRVSDGVLFTSEIHVRNPETIQDHLLAGIVGKEARVAIRNIDPVTRVEKTAAVFLGSRELRHLETLLGKLAGELEAQGL